MKRITPNQANSKALQDAMVALEGFKATGLSMFIELAEQSIEKIKDGQA